MVLEKTLEHSLRRLNQSILKEINLEYSLQGLMVKLKLQYCGHLMQSCSLEKPLMLVKIEDRRRRGQERMRWLDGIIDSVDMSLNVSKYGDLVFWGSKITADGDCMKLKDAYCLEGK